MGNVKLKPCPFCGGKAYLETNHRAFIKAQTTKVAYVRCLNCNARTQRIELAKYGKTSHSIEANNEAVQAWNRRIAANPSEINANGFKTDEEQITSRDTKTSYRRFKAILERVRFWKLRFVRGAARGFKSLSGTIRTRGVPTVGSISVRLGRDLTRV